MSCSNGPSAYISDAVELLAFFETSRSLNWTLTQEREFLKPSYLLLTDVLTVYHVNNVVLMPGSTFPPLSDGLAPPPPPPPERALTGAWRPGGGSATFHFRRPNFPCSLQDVILTFLPQVKSHFFSQVMRADVVPGICPVKRDLSLPLACPLVRHCLPHQPKIASRLQCHWAHERHLLPRSCPCNFYMQAAL